MKLFFVKGLFVFFWLILALSVYSQTDIEKKRLEGKTAYDNGEKFLAERNYKSYLLSLKQFQLSAKIYGELPDPNDKYRVGRALLGVGLIKYYLAETQESIEAYNQALAIFRTFNDKKNWEATALNRLGMMYEELGEREKALEMQNIALPLQKSIGDKFGEAYTLQNMGTIHKALGENAKALEYLERALAIHIELGEKHYQASVLNSIGQVYSYLRNTQKSLEVYNRSLELLKIVGDKEAQAVLLNNIGTIKLTNGQYKEALGYFEQTIAIFTELGFENRKATVLGNIGIIYLQFKEPNKALQYHRQSLPLYRAMGEKEGEAIGLLKLGYTQSEIGDNNSALENLNQALLLSRLVRSKEREAESLTNLMNVYKNLDNLSAAIIFGKQGIDTYQQLRFSVKDLDNSVQSLFLKSIAHNYRRLADLLIEAGRFAEAEGILQMLKEEEFSKFVRRDADEIKSLNRRITLTEKEKQIIEKYSQLANNAAEIGEEFRKLESKKRQLARREQTLSADEQKKYQLLSQQVADANAAFRLFLEKELVKELGNKVAKNIELDRDLQEKLKKQGNGIVALYTVLTEDRYRVILTTPTVQIDGKTEIKAEDLNRKIFEFLDALQNKNVDPRFLGKELYDILLKPVEKELKASNAKTLVWSLDGVLRYIPLAALSPDGENYLIEQYQNVLLTSKTREDSPNSKDGWLALGMGVTEEQSIVYPEFPDQKVVLSPLPAVKNELLSIIQDENNPAEKGIFKGRRFFDKDFTLNNLENSLAAKSPNGKKKFNVVHFASHFRLGGDWGESFLLLGNGKILTLETLSNSPSLNFDEVELVTLSACKTGITTEPDGKEFESLAGAIQAKGGRTVMATLWDVVDESTSLLMSNFYRIKKENPTLTKAEALQIAQKFMIEGDSKTPKIKPSRNGFMLDKKRPYSHPYYWSPFVIYGNWR